MVHLTRKKGNDMGQSAGSERAVVVCFVALVLFSIAFVARLEPFSLVTAMLSLPIIPIGLMSVSAQVDPVFGRGRHRPDGSGPRGDIWRHSRAVLLGCVVQRIFKGSPGYERSAGGNGSNLIVPVIAYISLVLILLYPVFTCRRISDGLAERLQFLLIVFSVLIGWHPVLINVFLRFYHSIYRLPRSYYLFSQEAHPLRFRGYQRNLLALLYLVRPGPRSRVVLFVFAAFAQATMENLGGRVRCCGVFHR